MPDTTSPSKIPSSSAVARNHSSSYRSSLNHAQMMRRLYVRCHCGLHPCENSSLSGLVRRFAVPHALLLERVNHILCLRGDLLSIARLLLLPILLAIHQSCLGDRPRLPNSSVLRSSPWPVLPLSRSYYTSESELTDDAWKNFLRQILPTRRFQGRQSLSSMRGETYDEFTGSESHEMGGLGASSYGQHTNLKRQRKQCGFGWTDGLRSFAVSLSLALEALRSATPAA